MPEQDRTLQQTNELLSRFDEHASRVTPLAAAKVRAVLGKQIVALGGELPPHVDLTAHPMAEGRPTASRPAAPHPTLTPDPDEFDFDLDATPLATDTRTRMRAIFDVDNPRMEDLSQFDLEAVEPALELDDGPDASLALQLDAAAPGEPEGPPRLIVNAGADDEQVLQLADEQGEVTLGRGKSCRIRLKDARASRLHCRIFATAAGGWAVEDMGSANGTQVNGSFLTARTPFPLSGGEEVIVGSTVMRYEIPVTVSA